MQERPKRLHPFWNLIKSDGRFMQERPKRLHPFFALIKSDGGCHSQANRKSQREAATAKRTENHKGVKATSGVVCSPEVQTTPEVVYIQRSFIFGSRLYS